MYVPLTGAVNTPVLASYPCPTFSIINGNTIVCPAYKLMSAFDLALNTTDDVRKVSENNNNWMYFSDIKFFIAYRL